MSTPTVWYYHKESRGFGPAEEDDIRELLARNEIAADTLVWREGLSNWTKAQSTELFSDTTSPARAIPIVPSTRLKHSNVFWLFFALAEIFNLLIFGALLIAVLVLSASGEVIPTIKESTNVPQDQQPRTNQIPN
jgi:hypothetical protein